MHAHAHMRVYAGFSLGIRDKNDALLDYYYDLSGVGT
jgi:hypothetical protein